MKTAPGAFSEGRFEWSAMSKAQLVITAVVLEGRSKARLPATTTYRVNGYTFRLAAAG